MSDPRARNIVSLEPVGRHEYLARLDCGHTVRRRLMLRKPKRLVCTLCPAQGGMGGHFFEHKEHAA